MPQNNKPRTLGFTFKHTGFPPLSRNRSKTDYPKCH